MDDDDETEEDEKQNLLGNDHGAVNSDDYQFINANAA